MTPTPGQSIALPTLPNLRDLGGWPTTDGSQVRSGVLYRSTDLSRLDDADRQTLTDLGLRSIYDLRTLADYERSHRGRAPFQTMLDNRITAASAK